MEQKVKMNNFNQYNNKKDLKNNKNYYEKIIYIYMNI